MIRRATSLVAVLASLGLLVATACLSASAAAATTTTRHAAVYGYDRPTLNVVATYDGLSRWRSVRSMRPATRVSATPFRPGVAAAEEETTAAGVAARTFGSGRGPHSAQVTVTRNGQTIVDESLTSGGMTPDEAALGFPKSTLATHTEARAVRQYPLEPGDVMTIRGQYPPCPSCKGAMNQAARSQGATIRYEWPGGSWTAGGRP